MTIDIKEIAKQSGFYFHDAGYAPIEHTLAREYSEMCFDRFARKLLSSIIEELDGTFAVNINDYNHGFNAGIERVVSMLKEINNQIPQSVADKMNQLEENQK